MKRLPTMDDAARAAFRFALLVVCLEIRGVLPPIDDADLIVL